MLLLGAISPTSLYGLEYLREVFWGPVLFLHVHVVYIDDLRTYINSSNILIFADDS